MHELSVTTRILDTALRCMRDNNLSKIYSITLEIGAMNDYEDQWLTKYFNELAEGTPAHGANLIIDHKPFIFKCKDCGHELIFDVRGKDDCTCPGCKGINFTMISGRQFEITSIEAE